MPSSRRQFLLAGGVTALAGCLDTTPDYQLVGAVEQKLLRGTRENTNEPVATNRPVAPGQIGDAAPTAVALETVPHETTVRTLTADGSLTVDGGEYDALTAGYDELHWLLDVTLYNDDPVLELSAGSGHAYRGPRQLPRGHSTPGN